jgi:hypothetical protein
VLTLSPALRVHLAMHPVSFHLGTDVKILWFEHGGFVVAHNPLASYYTSFGSRFTD